MSRRSTNGYSRYTDTDIIATILHIAEQIKKIDSMIKRVKKSAADSPSVLGEIESSMLIQLNQEREELATDMQQYVDRLPYAVN